MMPRYSCHSVVVLKVRLTTLNLEVFEVRASCYELTHKPLTHSSKT